jgi:hypothetical protein
MGEPETQQPRTTASSDHERRLAAGRECFEAAKTYLALGLSVLTCCDPHHIGVGRTHVTDCTSPGKVPMHRWKVFQERLPTLQELEHHWRDYPIGNVGCALGQVSGVVRVDVDGPVGETLLQEMSQGDLPPTWTFASSPAGYGLLYQWPADLPCQTTSLQKAGAHQELRLMGNGSQTVLPPSRHPSGSRYTWQAGHSPAEMPPAPAPAWLIGQLYDVRREAPPPSAPTTTTPEQSRVASALSAIPNDEAPYDTWLMLGMALHSTETPWAEALWDTWSRQSPKFQAAKQGASWQSFQTNRAKTVSIGSLFFLARQHGWSFASSLASPENAHGPNGAISPGQLRPESPRLFVPTLLHTPLPLAPPLPTMAFLDPILADGAAPWLDAYCVHSAHWSPRAAHGFHQAVGLWMLSTIAARRMCVELGSPMYPVLFLAMVARSTLYAKTTTAKLGREGLIQAGCGHLLAADRATPQALLKSMSGRVPQDYGSLPQDAQELLRARVAFAAQRGWYFEEWGGMLQQMTRRDSPMAEFHGLLRVLDDGFGTFTSETIARGLEHVEAPYLSLLASATPHDLARFMEPGSAWWHDGFWPRFALIVPYPDEPPREQHRPWGSARLSPSLVEPLQAWHRRLGVPSVDIEASLDAKGKPTGEWRAVRTPLPLQTLPPSPATQDAYERYNSALLRLIKDGEAPPDLAASYGRLHDKALRIALLLASFAHQDTISVQYWTYAQQVVETWRLMLHQVLALVAEGRPETREEQLENKIESLVAREGPRTARELHQGIRGWSSKEIAQTLQAMCQVDRLGCQPEGKTKRYGIPLDIAQGTLTKEETN